MKSFICVRHYIFGFIYSQQKLNSVRCMSSSSNFVVTMQYFLNFSNLCFYQISAHRKKERNKERDKIACIAKSKVKNDTSLRENWERENEKKSNKLVCVYHCSITISWKYCLIIECLEWKWEQLYNDRKCAWEREGD